MVFLNVPVVTGLSFPSVAGLGRNHPSRGNAAEANGAASADGRKKESLPPSG